MSVNEAVTTFVVAIIAALPGVYAIFRQARKDKVDAKENEQKQKDKQSQVLQQSEQDRVKNATEVSNTMMRAWQQTLESLRQELANERIAREQEVSSRKDAERRLEEERSLFRTELVTLEEKVSKLENENEEGDEKLNSIIALFNDVIKGISSLVRQLRKIKISPVYTPDIDALRKVGLNVPDNYFHPPDMSQGEEP